MEAALRFGRGLSKRTRPIGVCLVAVPLVLALCTVSGMGSNKQSAVSPAPARQGATPETATRRRRASQTAARARIESAAATLSTAKDRGFLHQPERVILDKLINSPVVHIKDSPGGRSVAFRLKLADGTRAFYKPEQRFSAAQWYAEVVSFYLDRALGLNRVAPTVSRRLPWGKMSREAEKHPRKNEVVVAEDGTVKGALIWWLPKRLVPLETPAGWENWVRIEPWPKWKVSPCQRPKEYVDALKKQRAARGKSLALLYFQAPEPGRPERGAELSDMMVFDFLTLNLDRWGGDNCNVLLHGPGGPLIFLDNGAGFSEGPARRNLMDERLRVVQRFRRSTVDALQRFEIRKFKDVLKRDRLAPLLNESDLKGLEIRRRAVLKRVSDLKAQFGEEAVLPW
ncbi:MAG: hypothetical protein JXA30_04515 [Deltaproteobacteria bacterium]|nr:hypothetical protein [Deltaproteobacteria bacterium]